LDLETVFHAEGSSTAEIEALAVKTLLEANGIDVVLVGDSMLPNLPFEVKVRRDQVKRARKLIGETASARALIAERLAYALRSCLPPDSEYDRHHLRVAVAGEAVDVAAL
jgi:hypothetical protein